MKRINFAYYVLTSYLKMKWYDIFNLKKASLVVLINEDNKILSVSRKDDHNDFGLCGGKVDKDESFVKAAKRELMEETGLIGYNLKPIFVRNDGGYICVAFLSSYKGIINVTDIKETGVIKWLTFKELNEGSFGDYNKELEKILKKIKNISI